jgi:hypothetical protein
LVATLPNDAPPQPVPEEDTGVRIPELLADFCGFPTLDEARDARNKLRAARVPAEILITDGSGAPPQEEYWLRARQKDFPKIAAIIGFDPADTPTEDSSFACSACGETVQASDDACPGCGLRFEE